MKKKLTEDQRASIVDAAKKAVVPDPEGQREEFWQEVEKELKAGDIPVKKRG